MTTIHGYETWPNKTIDFWTKLTILSPPSVSNSCFHLISSGQVRFCRLRTSCARDWKKFLSRCLRRATTYKFLRSLLGGLFDATLGCYSVWRNGRSNDWPQKRIGIFYHFDHSAFDFNGNAARLLHFGLGCTCSSGASSHDAGFECWGTVGGQLCSQYRTELFEITWIPRKHLWR